MGVLMSPDAAHPRAACILPPPPTISPKFQTTTAADWDLADEIGSGAFGVVRLGIRRTTGEVGAIKMQKDAREPSMQRELDALQRIKAKGGHKNIVDLKDVFEHNGHTCIVTEFVSGGELFEHIVRYGAFEEPRARKMMQDIVEGVAFLHDHGLVHKDLKPENVLLRFSDKRDDNPATLVDFGSAGPASRVLDTDIGTTVYLPPEVLRRGGVCTPAADVWAMGCILYIVLTGRHPFDIDGTAPEKTIESRIRKGHVSFKHAACQHLSSDAKDLIRHMLQKDPEMRPSAKQVLAHPWMTQQHQLVLDIVMMGAATVATDNNQIRSKKLLVL
ncbi:hypothetical protein DYB38_010833 [Aphanomyces astaci]|uniref:Protein kinase domain-containing protein n=1 Tax=Aphanomyces astaci TaxID=112090 RepID=A0A397CCP9_APHAT|nr:hypothetical protein DYB38_010833 [Aphanomyces astaci]